MAIRFAVAVLSCLAPLCAQEAEEASPKKEPPPREIARQAAKELKVVAKDGDVEQIRTALRELGLIDDTDVVRTVGKLIDDEREDVRWAAIRTLRYNPNPKAGSELIAAAKDKAIQASEPLYAEVLRGIGQHADPRALALLAEGFGPKKEPLEINEARIDAVGRIRTSDAVDTLIKYARSGFAKDRDARICTALKGLTGEDHGDEMRPWVLWWNRAKLGYRFPENPPAGPAAWTRLWETPTPERMFDRGSSIYGGPPTTGEGRGRGGRGGGGDAGGGRGGGGSGS
jgi:uncharacterized membrane protein YgcG